MTQNNTLLRIYTVSEWVRKAWRIESLEKDQIQVYQDILQKVWLFYGTYPSEHIWGCYDLVFSASEDIVSYIIKYNIQEVHGWEKSMNEKLWLLYWYPKCCISHFEKIQYASYKNDSKEIESVLKESIHSKYPFFLNSTVPQKVFFHLPCSLDCKKTEELAKKHLTILRKKSTNKKEFLEYTEKLKWTYSLWERIITFI